MTVINTVNSQKFTFNGVEYFKNFMPYVVGDKIRILNVYDSSIELTDFPTLYSDFEVDGNTFANVGLLQTALLPVLYNRDTLGYSSSQLQTDNITTTYNIDWNIGTHYLTMTANTTLTESNLPSGATTKVISIYITGNFALTLPANWSTNIIGGYDGTVLNQIVVEYISSGVYWVTITQPD